ncbi:hypothetical protein K491DRAFT_605309 [Lophiostoma macrostomum CBS 122681]|uniref:Zn(2)-C6 fungal-type domain-containing protein n=1 Tax=Lophiostoma macrostomum CBS 122681 TaxID=1314788 RepID=A0A6A6SWU9_9PLEO|nr:hypothetical protein K491DRAFT_605309 [Lophiostoma macrostomum CBS 122681]
MVFRGRPSKACSRCRQSRLRCDLQTPSCTPCIRAGTQCAGYRDVSTLRIADQTKAVRAKAVAKRRCPPPDGFLECKPFSSHIVHPIPLDLQDLARDFFFANYIYELRVTWAFLCPFSDPLLAPSYLALAIEAASLALLGYQHHSIAARSLSRQKYVAALRQTNKALRCPLIVQKETALVATLVLDLYEKITNSDIKTEDISIAHVQGAMALVRLRGLSAFNNVTGIQILGRILLNSTVTCLQHRLPIPPEIEQMWVLIGMSADPQGLKYRLSGLTLEVANFSAATKNKADGLNDDEKCIRRCIELETAFSELGHDVSADWSYTRHTISLPTSTPTPNDRYLQDDYHVYPSRRLSQIWNIQRLSRILLWEDILSRRNGALGSETHVVRDIIVEICASAPHVLDCHFAARCKLPESEIMKAKAAHQHTNCHVLDAYVTMYPLYVAAWSTYCAGSTREWIVKQFEHMSEHFGIREAALVRDVIESWKKDGESGRSVKRESPWEVYRLLGSYTFAT